jgi:hypothetical protein
MDLTTFASDDHQQIVGSRAVAYVGPPGGAGRGNVTVAPPMASPGGRGLRVQGMPWRRWLTTTPGRLRSASALLVIGLLVFAAVTTAATEVRSRAAGAVATTSAPELATAENLYGNLADADTTASTIFLRAGQEPRQLRRRYLADVAAAGRQLADISRSADSSSAARRAMRTISARLPEYAGLVESARANNAQGFPVGSAYLREASATMHNEILPAATDLYRDTARQLRDNYEAGTSTLTLVLVLVAGVGILALLVVVQIFVRRRSNRLLNVGLVGATVLVVGIFGWTLIRFAGAHDALNRAQERGSDSVEVLSSARILTLRAQNNENLALIERGTGDVYVAEFERLVDQLGGTDAKAGLLGYAATIADRTGDGARIRALAPEVTALRDLHAQVRAKDTSGDYTQAVALSVGTSNPTLAAAFGPAGPGQELAAVDELQHSLQDDIAGAQVRLASAAQDARAGFGVLEVAIPLFAVLAGLLVLLGLERRIGEYR